MLKLHLSVTENLHDLEGKNTMALYRTKTEAFLSGLLAITFSHGLLYNIAFFKFYSLIQLFPFNPIL